MNDVEQPTHPLGQRYVAALRSLETDGDAETVAGLFVPSAGLSRLGVGHDEQGRDGALAFWTQYGDTFDRIASRFTAVTEDEQRVALEWTAEGTLSSGADIRYAEVSILDLGSDSLTGFRTYYHSAAFTFPQHAAADGGTTSPPAAS